MTSRLASLLVQEGLVSPKKMAEAFQRQVIYGGALDTILLEMELIGEAVLISAMGRASGLPTGSELPSRTALQAANVTDWFPLPMCEKFRAVPSSVDGNVLRVLVTDPPDRKQLDELGYQLRRSIDPVVVPEHRFMQVVELVYGVAMSARFTSLAAKVRQRIEDAPTTRHSAPGKLSPIETPAPQPTVAAPVAAPVLEPKMAPATQAGTGAAIAPARVLTPASVPMVVQPVLTPAPTPEAPVGPVSDPVVTQVLPTLATTPSVVVTEHAEQPTPRITLREPSAPQSIRPEVVQQTGATSFEDPSPIPLAEAVSNIDAATERDQVLEALCRGARSQLEFVALFMVHGDNAVGRMALADHWLSRDLLGGLAVPLDQPSPFRTAVQTKAPYLGRLGEEGGVQTLLSLGRRPPLPAVLIPLVLKERVVALLYGDRHGKPLEAAVMAELSLVTTAAARAFQRLILRQKGTDYAAAPQAGKVGKVAAPSAEVKPAKSSQAQTPDSREYKDVKAPEPRPEPKPITRPVSKPSLAATPAPPKGPSAGAWHRVDVDESIRDRDRDRRSLEGRRNTVLGFLPLAEEVPVLTPSPAPAMTDAEALVHSVIREDEHARIAAEGLLLLGARGAEAVVANLPGPLRLDRHTLRGPLPPLGEHGPLLSVLARLGQDALPSLVQRLSDGSVEVRYYATLAMGHLASPSVVAPLGQRLWDADASVRSAAAAALTRLEMGPELRSLTEGLRGELPGPDLNRQRHASEALGVLRDVPSVPRLIELIKHPENDLAVTAQKALVEITKQDFGSSRWRWRTWWERHRTEARLEWLLEGLAHADLHVRVSAADELRALSGGETFGFLPDANKRDRDESRKRWLDWWRRK